MNQAATIDEFLSATAAAQPTPGGGSVAALAGALASALGEMVLNYSVGKKKLEAYDAELRAALPELTRARRLLLGFMVEDQQAYAALSAARAQPQSPEFTAALAACVSVPQAVAATAVAILELCDKLADKVNPHLISDLAICADLAMTAVRASMHNIRINLADVSDMSRRGEIEAGGRKIFMHALSIIQHFSRRFS